jgi:hypothetical protein
LQHGDWGGGFNGDEYKFKKMIGQMDSGRTDQIVSVPMGSGTYVITRVEGGISENMYAIGWVEGEDMTLFYIDPHSGEFRWTTRSHTYTRPLADVSMTERPKKIQSTVYVDAIYYFREDKIGGFEKGSVRKIILPDRAVMYIFFSTSGGKYHFRCSLLSKWFSIARELGPLDQLEACSTQEETPAT